MVTIRDLLRRTGDTVRTLVRTRFDATAVRRAEEERRRIAEQLELATKLSRVYVWSFDLVDGELDTGRATFVNVWESLGYDPPEATVDFAGTLARVVLEEDREALREANLAAIEGRTPTFEHEFRIRHGDGTVHWNRPRDLILLDLHMPEMDGFEVVRVIRARERESGGHLPIIALTARSLDRDRERSLAAGMDDFLSKPIEVKVLWAAIDRAMTTFPPTTRTGARRLEA